MTTHPGGDLRIIEKRWAEHKRDFKGVGSVFVFSGHPHPIRARISPDQIVVDTDTKEGVEFIRNLFERVLKPPLDPYIRKKLY